MISRPYFSYGIEQLQELFSNSKTDLKILKSIQYELSHREKPKARALKNEVDQLIKQQTSSYYSTSSRPYFSYGIEQLQELFSNSKTDLKILKSIQYELSHREKPKARALKNEVDQLIKQQTSTPPLSTKLVSKTLNTPPRSSTTGYNNENKQVKKTIIPIPDRVVVECAYCNNTNFVSTIEDTIQHLSCSSCGRPYTVIFKYGVVRTSFPPLKDSSSSNDTSLKWLIVIGIIMLIIVLEFIRK